MRPSSRFKKGQIFRERRADFHKKGHGGPKKGHGGPEKGQGGPPF